jgi:hypothetical protein
VTTITFAIPQSASSLPSPRDPRRDLRLLVFARLLLPSPPPLRNAISLQPVRLLLTERVRTALAVCAIVFYPRDLTSSASTSGTHAAFAYECLTYHHPRAPRWTTRAATDHWHQVGTHVSAVETVHLHPRPRRIVLRLSPGSSWT